jgi:deoxyribose-phosphate aldolase
MNVNQYIDHTLLKPDAQSEAIIQLCNEAQKYEFAAVCVNATYVPLAFKLLEKSKVLICTVVGFPLGASPTETKVHEANWAMDNGADEIDMVINIGALKDNEDSIVENDIAELAKACHSKGKILKVIIETCLLNEEQKIRACKLAVNAKADFVKTSTGFAGGGATLEDVELMRKTVGPDMGVKASGGVRDLEMANKMIAVGATRLGTSSGVKIVEGMKSDSDY